MGIGAGVQLARWLGAGAIAALLACRPEPVSDRRTPTTSPVVLVTAPTAAPAPAGTPDSARPPSASVQGSPSGREVGASAGRFAFDFEDADLPELVRLVGAITGKRFILSGKLPTVHATVHSPEPVTADEAYEAFLSILQANGLTVAQRGAFWKITPSPGQ